METYWHNPLITQNLLDVISDTGFKSIRLPVSYYNHIQDGIIDSLWLDRVE